MKVRLTYRCRFCRQDVTDDALVYEVEMRARIEVGLLENSPQTIVHDCTSSGSHLGLCDLVGAVVTEE